MRFNVSIAKSQVVKPVEGNGSRPVDDRRLRRQVPIKARYSTELLCDRCHLFYRIWVSAFMLQNLPIDLVLHRPCLLSCHSNWESSEDQHDICHQTRTQPN